MSEIIKVEKPKKKKQNKQKKEKEPVHSSGALVLALAKEVGKISNQLVTSQDKSQLLNRTHSYPVRIRNEERVGQLKATNSATPLVAFTGGATWNFAATNIVSFNPGLAWIAQLSAQAGGYNLWRPLGDLRFRFEQIDTEFLASSGTLSSAFNPDSTDDFVIDAQLLESENSVHQQVSKPVDFVIKLKDLGTQWRFIRTGSLSAQGDVKLYDAGTITIFNYGCPALLNNMPLFRVYVSYDVEVKTYFPQSGASTPCCIPALFQNSLVFNTHDSNNQPDAATLNLFQGSSGMTWTTGQYWGGNAARDAWIDMSNMLTASGSSPGNFILDPGMYLVSCNIQLTQSTGFIGTQVLYSNITGADGTSHTNTLQQFQESTNYMPGNSGAINGTWPILIPYGQSTSGTGSFYLSLAVASGSGTWQVKASAINSTGTWISVMRLG